MFAAFDGLEEKRFALSANFAISGKGRLEIGQQTAGDRDEIALPSQFQKLVPRRKIHSRGIEHNHCRFSNHGVGAREAVGRKPSATEWRKRVGSLPPPWTSLTASPNSPETFPNPPVGFAVVHLASASAPAQ